jgi:hypothetical protein
MAKKKASNEVAIEIKNEELVNGFFPAIEYLGSLAIKNVDILTKIVKAKRTAKALVEDYNEARKMIVEQDCKKDADGKPVTEYDEDFKMQRYKYETADDELSATNAVKELTLKKVKFNVVPIKLGVLRNIEGLSANTIDSLYEFVDIG